MCREAEDRVQRAVELFMQGYSCSQSVVMAFSDLYGVDPGLACRLSTGFGGGVGRLRMLCGAVSGIVMLAGLERNLDGKSDSKTACYELVQQFVNAFKEENGSLICAELLQGCPVTSTPQASERNAEYYKVRPCARKVESAARIFAQYYYSR